DPDRSSLLDEEMEILLGGQQCLIHSDACSLGSHSGGRKAVWGTLPVRATDINMRGEGPRRNPLGVPPWQSPGAAPTDGRAEWLGYRRDGLRRGYRDGSGRQTDAADGAPSRIDMVRRSR